MDNEQLEAFHTAIVDRVLISEEERARIDKLHPPERWWETVGGLLAIIASVTIAISKAGSAWGLGIVALASLSALLGLRPRQRDDYLRGYRDGQREAEAFASSLSLLGHELPSRTLSTFVRARSDLAAPPNRSRD